MELYGQYFACSVCVYAVEEMSRSAMRFGNACNGILRATACLYQALFREGGAGPECDP